MPLQQFTKKSEKSEKILGPLGIDVEMLRAVSANTEATIPPFTNIIIHE